MLLIFRLIPLVIYLLMTLGKNVLICVHLQRRHRLLLRHLQLHQPQHLLIRQLLRQFVKPGKLLFIDGIKQGGFVALLTQMLIQITRAGILETFMGLIAQLVMLEFYIKKTFAY